MMHLLLLLTCLFCASSVFAQTLTPLPNVGIEISPSSVITQPLSTLSLRATAYSSLPNCDIISYTWSTLMTPTSIPAAETSSSSQPIFTTPNDRITSITGLITLGTYNFQIVVTDACNATTTLTFNSIVANSSLESDFFVLPPTIVTTPGFVFPPTLPPTLTPITSAPTDPTPPPIAVDPSLPGPTDPNTGAPVGGGGGGEQQPQPNPPVVNAGQGGLNNSPSNTSFNMMYVVIPAAVVGGLLFIGICMYCRRKSQIPNRTQSSSTSSIMIGTKISQPFEAFTGANQLTSPV